MKKFTVSLLTAMIFVVVSMLNCFSVFAEQQEMSMSISREEYEKIADIPTVASDISIEADNKTYSFYSQLNGNNKAAYDAMEASLLEPNTAPIIYTLTDKVTFNCESTDINSWTEEQTAEFWGHVFATFQTGQVAFEYDNPQVFWYDKNKMQVSIASSSRYSFREGCYVITVTKVQLTPAVKEVLGDEETALEAQNFLLDKIETFEIKGDDYYSKIKYMHDYIANAVTYDITAPYTDTAYGMFVDPYSIICEGYSEAMVMLCRKENIPCISVIGNVNADTNIAHMWNYIMMEDGNWYALDATWDDLDKENNPVKYQYFLNGSDNFFKNHTEDNEYVTPGFVYPELSASDYVYKVTETTPVVTTSVSTTLTETTTTEVTTTLVSTESENTTTKALITSVTSVQTTDAIISEAVTTTVTSQTETTEPIENILKGDFNKNGILDIGDLISIQKKLTKLEPIEKVDFEYELNGDNKLNIWDYIILIRLLKV